MANATNTSNPISAVQGGTGQSSYATGDVLYASNSTTLSKLAVGSNGDVLTLSAGIPSWAASAGGGVTSVTGTTNRITSSGGSTPVIDISASYVGQNSITTLGTIGTGVWQGTKVAEGFGGTNQSTYATGDMLYASGSNALSKLSLGNFGSSLGVNSTNIAWVSPSTTYSFYSDFDSFNDVSWNENNTGSGTVTKNTAAVANHPGIWTIATGTDTTGAEAVHLTEVSMMLDGGQILLEWCVKIPTLSNGTDTFTVRIGVLDNFQPAEATNAVEFRYTSGVNSGNWQLIGRNGGSETATNSSTAVGTGWTRLSIVIVPLTPLATFYVNGVSVGTVASNIPTTNPVGIHAQIVKTAGTTSRTMLLDYATIFNQLASAR